MTRSRHKTPDELMQEAMWSRMDICRIFRRDPRTIDKYINNPDPKKRLKGYIINGEFMAEKRVVLRYFEYRPFGNN
jgi:hypothetical protein